MSDTRYAIRYRRGSKGGRPAMTVTLFFNPTSNNLDGIVAYARNMWHNKDSNNLLAISVVSYVETETVWNGYQDDLQRPTVDESSSKAGGRSRKYVRKPKR